MVSLMATENVHGKRVISILGRSKVGSSTDKAPLNAQVKHGSTKATGARVK